MLLWYFGPKIDFAVPAEGVQFLDALYLGFQHALLECLALKYARGGALGITKPTYTKVAL